MAKQLGSITVGNTLEMPVLGSYQVQLGSKIIFQIVQKNGSENSVTLVSKAGISIIDYPQNNSGLRFMRDLPADIWVSDQPNTDGNYECAQQPANTAPSAPASITYGIPMAGQNIALTCDTSTDPDGDAIQYIWERSIDSGAFAQIGITSETFLSTTVPTSGTTFQARVKAVDIPGNESAYATGTVFAINKVLSAPASITYATPTAGKALTLTCGASTDSNGDTIQYIWEYNIDGGTFTQIGATGTPSASVIIPMSGVTFQARVKISDGYGNESAYTAGTVVALNLPLYAKKAGDIVKIKEGSEYIPFLVIQHNYRPGETLVLRQDNYNQLVAWRLTEDFNESGLCAWLNSFYYGLIDPNVISHIQHDNILPKIFALSVYELFQDFHSNFCAEIDGTYIPYFDSALKRGGNYWTRTFGYVYGRTVPCAVDPIGSGWIEADIRSEIFYPRPAFCLSSNIDLDENGIIIAFSGNYGPSIPGPVIYGSAASASKDISLVCGASISPNGSPIQYVWEHRVDNGSYTVVGITSRASLTVKVPENGNFYQVRVKAQDNHENESEYTTGVAIVINKPPTMPSSISYPEAVHGGPLTLTCGASSDPNGDVIQYVWEYHIDSSGFIPIGITSTTAISINVPATATIFQARVKAVDSLGNESTYIMGPLQKICEITGMPLPVTSGAQEYLVVSVENTERFPNYILLQYDSTVLTLQDVITSEGVTTVSEIGQLEIHCAKAVATGMMHTGPLALVAFNPQKTTTTQLYLI